jgi:hypothetical protein
MCYVFQASMRGRDSRMNRSMEERYVIRSQIPSLTQKLLYYGEDLSLKREVILYRIVNLPNESVDEYISKFKKASSFVHPGFQHILDTSIEEHSIFIVLKHRSGKPILPQLKQQSWTFSRIISMISDLGVSMLDGMEAQITGYSVGVENLWLGDDNRLSIINYWEDGESKFTGPLGLCSLIIQLSSGSMQIPNPYIALDDYLLQIDRLQASTEQKSALIKLVRRAYHGQASLSSLVIGLQGLLHLTQTTEKMDSPVTNAIPTASRRQTQQATIPTNLEILPSESDYDDEDEDEAKTPFYRRMGIVIPGLIVAAFLMWVLWPTSQTPKNPSETDPANQVQTPAPQATTVPPQATASPDRSQIGDGVDTTIPNLIGMTQADAENEAKASGLHYNYNLEINTAAKGTVFKQDPAPDTKAKKGDNVTFWVSKGSS